MTDNSHQSEFDDELLSAYLDDELSLAERTLVDERLAVDPAARTLMEQMRAVSLAVRGLPAEKLSVDLRESILARAEHAKRSADAKFARIPTEPASTESPAPPTEVERPRLPFGRTRRGWFWAGLAVAAALLMAFILPDDNGQHVAARRKPARDQLRIGDVEMRAVPSPAPPAGQIAKDMPAPPPMPANEAAPAAAPSVDLYAGVSSRGMAASPSAPANAPASETPAESAPDSLVDKSAARYAAPMETPADDANSRDTSLSVRRGAGVAGGYGGAKITTDGAPAAEQDFVVVHVSATTEAIENKSFEQVLASNGIAIDESVREEKAAAEVSLPIAQTAGAMADASKALNTTAPVAQVEMVLVEAPIKQITACLSTLRNDAANYVAVEVEGRAPQQTARVKQQVEALNLSQFSRGAISPLQKAKFAPVEEYFFDSRFTEGEIDWDDKLELYSGKYLGAPESGTDDADNLARARRVQSLGRSLYEPVPAPAEALGDKPPTPRDPASSEASRPIEFARKSVDRSIAADQLQVLFVISPEEAPAASPAAPSSPQ